MQHKRLTVGIITLGITLILNWLFGMSAAFYNTFYLKGLYQFIRVIHDYTLGLLPIPSLYLIVPCFFYFFYRNNVGSLKKAALATLTTLIWIVNLFYWLWGFNYTQPSIYEALDLERVSIDSLYIKEKFLTQTAIVDSLAEINKARTAIDDLDHIVRPTQETLLKEWGMPTYGKVRIRTIPSGSLLRIRTSGVYIPHAFEGHIDKGLYYKQHPFTVAHEMAHGYGYTDESVCNFIGYLTCLRSTDPLIRYSAELAYWRYLLRYYRYYYDKEWTEQYNTLGPALLADLEEIRKHINKYEDLMPVMRDKIYDNYLKTHGVKAGIKSYDEMIQLIAAYRQSGKQ